MRRLLIATFVLLMLLPAVTALAGDNAHDLLIDACRDENVDGTYSQATYKRALGQLPADSDQYTACRDVINRARLAALNNRRARGGGGGGGGGNTSAPSGGNGGGGNSSTSGTSSGASGSTTPVAPTAAEQKAVKKAISTGSSPVRVGGQLVQPGAVGSLASANRRIPTSLLALLIALAACAVLGAGALGWNRVIARRAH